VTVPFHGAAILHPKIVKQALEIIDEAAEPPASRE
jgi:predicted RNA binding protein YcfA (HicA-like mRNA interferase family)